MDIQPGERHSDSHTHEHAPVLRDTNAYDHSADSGTIHDTCPFDRDSDLHPHSDLYPDSEPNPGAKLDAIPATNVYEYACSTERNPHRLASSANSHPSYPQRDPGYTHSDTGASDSDPQPYANSDTDTWRYRYLNSIKVFNNSRAQNYVRYHPLPEITIILTRSFRL